MRVVFLLMLIVFTILLGTRKELYTVQKGSCDCCSCGWQSCDVCAANIKKCCGSKMGFQRYDFKYDKEMNIA